MDVFASKIFSYCFPKIIAICTKSFFFVLGKHDMILTAILEFVEVCLTGYNIPQAYILLNDAEALVQGVRKIKNIQVIYS